MFLALLSPAEKTRLKGLVLSLPLIGAFDALGLAIIIGVFLHVVGIREIEIIKQLTNWMAQISGQTISDRFVAVSLVVVLAVARFIVSLVGQLAIFRFISSVHTRLSSELFGSFLTTDLDYIARQDRSFGSRIVFHECARYAS